MISVFALPTSAARSTAGTLADPTGRGRRLNVRDIRDCPDRPGSDQLMCWVTPGYPQVLARGWPGSGSDELMYWSLRVTAHWAEKKAIGSGSEPN
jgi:hypothetical protein